MHRFTVTVQLQMRKEQCNTESEFQMGFDINTHEANSQGPGSVMESCQKVSLLNLQENLVQDLTVSITWSLRRNIKVA